MQAAPLAAAAAMAVAPPPVPAAVVPPPVPAMPVASPVPGRPGVRPATTPAIRTPERAAAPKPRRSKPVWLWYAVPTLASIGLVYGLWQVKKDRDAAAAVAARHDGHLTSDDLAFPDADDPSALKGLAVGEGTTPLSIDQARIVGGKARRRSSIKAIGYWSNPDTRVVWDVVITKPGEYEVLVTQSLDDAKMGGKYEVTLAGATVAGQAQKTGGKEQFAEVVVGVLKVGKKGPATLEIHPTEVIGTSLMNLGGVSLRKK